MCRLPQWAFTRAGTQPSVFLRPIPDVCIWEQPDTCVCPHRRLSHADRERPVARDPAPSRGGGGASHFTPNASQGSRTWSFREPQGFAVTALMSDFCFEGRLRNTALPGTGSEDHQAGLSLLPENLLPPRWSPPGPASWAPWGWPQTANSRAKLTHSHRLGTPKLGLGVQIWRQHLSGIRERPASGLHVRTQEMAHGHLPLPSQETQGQGLDSMPREALAGVRAPQD